MFLLLPIGMALTGLWWAIRGEPRFGLLLMGAAGLLVAAQVVFQAG